MEKDEFGNRMKLYEKEFYTPQLGYVNSNMPVFVRLDGKAFHNWIKQPAFRFRKPFDIILSQAFQFATTKTCEEIGQVIMAYSQSDEVTFLLNGWQNPESQIYFGGKIQKIVSVMSSIFTAYFNKFLSLDDNIRVAFFDARVWNVPEHEISNVFIWRQMDARRNSIQGLAQSLYSHKELNKKNSNELVEMCKEKGQNWNELSNLQKWGFVVKKEEYFITMGDGDVVRSRWIVDTNIPYFVDEPEYLNDIISTE